MQQALRDKPDYAEAYYNLGLVREEEGEPEEALACYQQAVRFKPNYVEAHWNRAMIWLLLGNYEQGWPEYEWRFPFRGVSLPLFPQPHWDGSPLRGQTILLLAEQGLGDTLQLIRYAALVKERGGDVLVTCPAALIPLLSSCGGIDRLLPQNDPLPPFDVYAPLLSLPRVFGTTLATVPAQVPYLSADAQLTDQWHHELSSLEGFKIGIAWHGSPAYQRDPQRSIPLEQFAPLAQLPGVRLVSLQKGLGAEQVDAFAQRFPLLNLGSRLDEAAGAFMDTAAVMKNLDLVITCDSALGHLAGALGVPVWVAKALVPDWRWLRERQDSPWYPTVRLFRQTHRGNWQGVFQRMADEIQRLTDR